MRLWLLAALAAAVLATHQENYEQAKNVLKSWDPKKPIRYVGEEEHDHQEEAPRRSKRSVMSMAATNKLGADKSCQTPGYTGEFCEYPICGMNNEVVPDNPATDGLGATIDMTNLANCSQEYVVLVDDTMFKITFELESDLPLNPYLSLFDDAGGLMFPDQTTVTRTATTFTSFYFYLPPGRYKAIPSADMPTSFCTLIVRAHSQLNVVGGFVSESDDAARNDFPGGIVYQDQASTAMFHANGQRSPGKLITVTFTGNDNSIYRPRLLNTRYNCSYEYFFETFTCRKTGSYLYHIEGVTFEGYNFRRAYPFMCMPTPPTQPPPTTTSTTPAPITGCKNDGFLINNLDGSSYCYCHGLMWTGADCSKIVCMNGGTVTDSNTCRCTPGYSGDHCEDIVCDDNKGLEFDALHPTLTLVLRVRFGMNNVNQQIMQATKDLIDKLQFDPDYLTSYILVLFNNDQILLNQRYTSSDALLSDLNSTAVTSTSAQGDCYDSVFTAVSTALTQYPNNKSPVYIVTDAPPKDVEVAETVFHQDSFWRAPLHFIYVKGDPLCALTPEDAKYKKMDDIAKRSGGMTFYLTNRTAVYDFTQVHMINTVYRSQLLLSNDMQTCMAQNTYQPFTIDSAVQQLTVTATGQQLILNVTQPSGDPFTRIDTAYDDNGNFIWILNGVQSGLWNIQVQAKNMGAACNYKIFQKLYNNIAGRDNTQYDLFWAFAPVVDMNGYETQPIYGQDLGIVAKLTKYPYLYPQYVTAGMNIYASRDDKQVEVYAANGIWRDGCDYNFFFPHYTCTVPNEILYFNFYARDQVGMAIQRAGTMYCSEISPTLEPPSDCQHGGVMAPSNTTCYCPLGYTGNKCEQITCFNGGTPLGNKCMCVQGWIGSFCEFPRCTAKGMSPEPQMKFVDMVFAVEMTQTGAGQIMMLNTYFPNLLRDITFQDTRWISKFVLTGFNSTWAGVIADAPSTNPKAVIDALAGIANSMNTDFLSFDKGCNVQVWKAFDVAILQREAVPGSYMELFVSSTPDNSNTVGWEQLYDFQRSMNLHINVYQAISAYTKANPTGYFCNGKPEDFYWLGAITGSAAGAIYPTQQGNIPQITKTIPNQYLSAIDYVKYEDDCTYGVDYYFPIDAYVQTIQLEVYGANPQVVLYGPDDKVYPADQLLQDTTSLLTISEVRKGCDDDWETHGQFCYKFHHEDMLSWADASDFCHQAKAQLADDMDPSSHSWFIQNGRFYNFWIGLYNTSTEWAWDRPPGVTPLPMNQDPMYWEGGKPPTDPNLGCVYYNGYNRGDGDTWTAEDCSREMWFVCQKHRYDQDFRPENLEYDDLPNGKWHIKITTVPDDRTTTRNCGLTARVQSELQIFTGYSQEIYTDTPDNDPYRDSNRNRLITYIHSQDNDYRTPVLFQAYLSDAYNETFYNAARYQERVNCEYPWVTQTFACPNAQETGNEFMVTHTGEDSFGNMFQRVTFGHCSRQPLTCGNGGYRWNGLCICNEYWQGSLCTVPICVNNGTLSPDLKSCQCPAGFTGFNCQLEKCDDMISTNFNYNYKTMLLIVENTIQNQKAIKNLANGFLEIVAAVDPTFFYNYIVISFNSTGVTSLDITEDPAQVVVLLNNLVQTDQGSCSMPLYTALYAFLPGDTTDYLQFPNSEIVLVTSAGASDEYKRQQDLYALSDWRVKVNYMYVTDSCGKEPTDGSLPNLVRTAYLTDGNVAFMSSDNLVLFLKTYLPTRFGANVLSNPTAHVNYTCDGTGNSWLVQVDTNTTYIYVTTSAELGSLGAKGPSGDGEIISPEMIYAKNNTKMYRIDTDRNAGIYKLNFVSPGNCFASIYSVGGAQVFTRYAVATPSDPSGSHQDGSSQSPSALVQNVLTAHLEGEPGHRGQLQYAEIFDVDTLHIVLRSELYRRDGPFGGSYPYATCQFEYVSDPFTCDSELLGVFVYGMDENNIQFRRQLVAHCLNSNASQVTTVSTTVTTSTSATSTSTMTTTTTTGPSTTTGTTISPTTSFSNLNLAFDVVFLVDTSKAATTLYDQMSAFIQALMSSYTINKNVHVGLIPVFGSDLGQMFAASLSEITSQALLLTRLNDMKDAFSDFDDQGQYLGSALLTASDPNYISPQNGYRPTLKNHVLVYITATTDFNGAPDTTSILQQSIYGVITIGFGGATDAAKLTTLSGGAACSFSAPDANTLNTATLNGVRDLIWAANFAGGVYCGNDVN